MSAPEKIYKKHDDVVSKADEAPEKLYLTDIGFSWRDDWNEGETQGYDNETGFANYTRTDTIPSRAQVAREFMDAALKRRDETRETFLASASNTLGEWEVEDAE